MGEVYDPIFPKQSGRTRSLFLGQLLSIVLTGTGVFTQNLAQNYSINIPATQNCINYLLLSSNLIISFFFNSKNYKLKVSWWKYALVAFVDLEANFLVVLAFKYTSISSIMLLDSFTIPTVMVLSRIYLNAKYTRLHVIGVSFCLFGILMLLLSDWLNHKGTGGLDNNNNSPYRALFGDLLCLLGACIYAVSNVAQEYLIKQDCRTEFLGMVGLFGFFFGFLQAIPLESTLLMAIHWNSAVVFSIMGYVLCMFALYNLTSIFLWDGDAAMLNLSLLTSDVLAVVCGVWLFGESLSLVYFIGFGFILLGLIVYSKAPAPTNVSFGNMNDPRKMECVSLLRSVN